MTCTLLLGRRHRLAVWAACGSQCLIFFHLSSKSGKTPWAARFVPVQSPLCVGRYCIAITAHVRRNTSCRTGAVASIPSDDATVE